MKKLMVIAVFLSFMTGSAYAADWNFYGSARVQTTYSKIDKNPFSNPAGAPAGSSSLGFVTGNDTSNYEQSLYGNARIGANVKVSEEVSGQFEYGAQSGNANIRILWGEYNFGSGSLGIGQNYTPLLFPYSNQTYSMMPINKGDHNTSTFGMLYGSRKAMIRLKFGNFQIAAVQPKTLVAVDTTTAGAFITGALATPGREVKIPSIQAKYKYDFKNGHIAVAGGYQTFDLVSGNKTHNVDSYIIGLGGGLNFGGLYVKGNVWGGQNVGNMADVIVNGNLWSTAANAGSDNFDGRGFGLAQWNGVTSELVDNDALAALLIVGYKIREGLYLEAGYGYVKTELDIASASKDDVASYYVQSTIFLAPGVFLTPEIGRIDSKQTNDPVTTYYGIKWQINF